MYHVKVNPVVKETDKAWGIEEGEVELRLVVRQDRRGKVYSQEAIDRLTWYPKSQCQYTVDDTGVCWIHCPEWIAKKNALVLAVKYGQGYITE